MLTHSIRSPAVLGCLILVSVGWLSCGAASLAQDVKPAYVVVTAQGATEAEAYAARELADYLGKIAGTTFPIVPEDQPATGPRRIFVGWTGTCPG